MPETPVIEVAPYGTNHRPPRVVWRLTLPKTPDVSGRIEVSNRDDALRLAWAIAGKYGWTVRESTPEGDVDIPGTEPAEAQRVRLQAGDILARLFPSIECVLIDHADELDAAHGRADANLAELAHVYRELTGFDARAATSGEASR